MPNTLESSHLNVRRKANPAVLKWARQIHLLSGTFFAPAIVFFALTGALQTFGLHESPPGSEHQPPAWVQRMAQLHKKQNMQLRPPRAASAKEKERPQQRGPEQASSSLLLKMFVGLMSIGLIITSALGVYMAFKFGRDRRLVWGLLVAGTVVPVLLIFL